MPRTTAGRPRAAASGRRHGDREAGTSPTELLAFAARQLGADGDGPGPDRQAGLSELLRRCTIEFGAEAAVAAQVRPGQEAVALAAYPAGAASPQHLAELARLVRRPALRGGGCMRARVRWSRWPDDEPAGHSQAGHDQAGHSSGLDNVLAAVARTPDDSAACLLALVGGSARRTSGDRDTVQALANLLCASQRLARDVAEADRQDRELAAGEARFRVLSHLAPVGIAAVDPDGRCTFVNARWSVLTSRQAADCTGRSWLDFVHPGDAARVRAQWEAAKAAGQELRSDFRLGEAAAEPLWVNAAIAASEASEDRKDSEHSPGHPAGYLIAITNISARKRAEAERARLLQAERVAAARMTEQTERLRSLVAAAIPGVMLLDENDNILQVNQGLCDLLGIKRPADEIAGHVSDEIAPAVRRTFADADDVIAAMRQRRLSEERVEGQRIPCADGRVLECDFWPVLVAGQYRGGAWLLWNMSERAETEQEHSRRLESELASRRAAEHARAELAGQNEELRAQNEQKMRFLSTVSHELRAPLASIVSYTELLEDEAGLQDEPAEYLRVIQRNAERLMHLVSDLLLLRRLEDGVLPLELAPVAVRDLVADAARTAAPIARHDGKLLDWSAAAGPVLVADRERILQAVDNLVANALKFTEPGATIGIRAAPRDGHWQIEISDSGIGIPADEVSRLCQRFFRASNTARSGRPGFGLGLAIVKEIVDMHDGELTVTSTVGTGSTFTLTLPAAGPPARAGWPAGESGATGAA